MRGAELQGFGQRCEGWRVHLEEGGCYQAGGGRRRQGYQRCAGRPGVPTGGREQEDRPESGRRQCIELCVGVSRRGCRGWKSQNLVAFELCRRRNPASVPCVRSWQGGLGERHHLPSAARRRRERRHLRGEGVCAQAGRDARGPYARCRCCVGGRRVCKGGDLHIQEQRVCAR